MSKYESYKPMGLPWLSQVPQHWSISRNKNVFEESKETVGENFSRYTLLSLTLSGIIPRDVSSGKGKFPQSFDTYKKVDVGDMAFCLFDIDETPRTVGLSEHQGMLTGAYNIFHVKNINPKYINYYYLSLDMAKAMKPLYTGLRKTIGIDTFMGTKIPVPPREEQNQIVRYLEWQTSKINRLIAAKKQQIQVLREQQQKLICEVITKGVHSDVGYKDSHIAWIGDIPSHWSAIRCKYLFRERDERSKEGMETHLSMSQKYGLVPDSQLDERRMLSESYAGGKLCYQDDLVLNRLKAHLGVFALAPQFGVISPDYTVLIPNTERIIPSFGEMVLKSALCRRELRVRVRGIIEGFWRLYTDDFYTIYLPVPPIEEQKEIMQYIDAQAKKTAALENALNREIELLHELRTRLISDVATGQIDVRSIDVPDYELVEELADEAEEPEDEMEVE